MNTLLLFGIAMFVGAIVLIAISIRELSVKLLLTGIALCTVSAAAIFSHLTPQDVVIWAILGFYCSILIGGGIWLRKRLIIVLAEIEWQSRIYEAVQSNKPGQRLE